MTRSRTPGPLRPAPPFAGLLASGGWFGALLVMASVVAAVVSTGATGVGPVPGIADAPVGVRFGIPTARVLLHVAAVAAAGVAVLARLLNDAPETRESVSRPAGRLGVLASAVWGLSALTSIWLLAWEISAASGAGAPSLPELGTYLQNVPEGKGLLISAACAAVSLVLGLVAQSRVELVPAELRLGIVLVGLLPLPLTGHASTQYWHDLAMISMELHVVAATVWAGGLGAVIVFLIRRPRLLAVAMPKFSALATWCVLAVGLTGLFTGLVELALSPTTSLPGSLLSTRYGVLLVAKMLLIAVVSAIAVVVRGRLLPRIRDGRPTAVAIWCGWELLVLALAFGVAAVLTRAAVVPF